MISVRVPPAIYKMVQDLTVISKRGRASIANECFETYLPVLMKQYQEFQKIRAAHGNGNGNGG